MASNPRLDILLKSLDDNQAIDIRVIDVKKQTSVTDYMVVCSGRSSRHISAIAEYLITDMKKSGFPAITKHGLAEGEWALIDFGEFVVHIMQPQSRDFYNLEDLWQKASDISQDKSTHA